VSTPYSPINCADYDYIEIACLYGYQLEVKLQSCTLTGKAITTEKTAEGEFLVLEREDKVREMVRADNIVKLVVLDKNAKFSEHTFN